MSATTTAANRLVDPELQAFVTGMAQGYAEQALAPDASLDERRAAAEIVRERWRTGGPEMAETLDLTHDGVKLRLHRPVSDTVLPVVVYIHGGGWILFSINTHDRLMREYAARAGVAVLGVDYSLSPEAKFPTALNEISAVVRWLEADGAAALNLDPMRIAIAGDSAGANLSVATCLKRREDGLPALKGALLSYGAFDPARKQSYVDFDGPDFTLEADEMDIFWELYTDNPAALKDPLVAPIHADLTGLPPMHLAIAQCDILADCNYDFAEKLAAAGVPITTRVYEGAVHSFLEAMSISKLANAAIDDQSAWLKALLAE